MKLILVYALAIFSGALALPEPHATGPHKVSLSKGNSLTHSNGSVKVHHMFASLANTLAKFQGIKAHLHDEPVAQHHAERRAGRRRETAHRPGKVSLTDKYISPKAPSDLAYYGPMTVGSYDGKPQDFQGCDNPTKYDQGGTALNKTAHLEYQKGTASGSSYTDVVTIGGLKSFNQTILSVNSTESISGGPVDGLVGMGISVDSQSTTFFENLIASGAVEDDEFSFYLGRVVSGTANDSELTLGGRDSKKYYHNFTTVPVLEPIVGFWLVKLDNVMVNGRPAGPHSAALPAAIDTGSSAIVAPHAVAEEIMSQIPGSISFPSPESDRDTY
ncbi:hypothetical protein KVR01_010022 [Diaporthe batatas]|uniref:uncharacterized protein n=1 Tax=Diaporthe batatas TaxID=748121 RepID=UPI001D04CCA3|nr:uncharacterized protein KVR01_010022 [Diaporthe batatas]KAG8160486.1 hypothetical protein KVR01_010022 [Diaporthe batatas]